MLWPVLWLSQLDGHHFLGQALPCFSLPPFPPSLSRPPLFTLMHTRPHTKSFSQHTHTFSSFPSFRFDVPPSFYVSCKNIPSAKLLCKACLSHKPFCKNPSSIKTKEMHPSTLIYVLCFVLLGLVYLSSLPCLFLITTMFMQFFLPHRLWINQIDCGSFHPELWFPRHPN